MDSDNDDYDRRNGRDKFRRERDDSDRRRSDDRRGGRMQGGGKRDFGGRDGRREGSPNGMGSKRNRRDFQDGGQDNMGGGGPMMPMMPMMPMGMGPMGMNPMAAAAMMAAASRNSQMTTTEDGQMTQPPMLTFKQFVIRLDDLVNEFEAAKGYSQYKSDFKRQVLSDFFEAHKDEEWFKVRYEPGVCEQRRGEQRKAVQRRREVFIKLYQRGLFGGFTLDMSHQSQIELALDAAVILLEGGSNEELEQFLLNQQQLTCKCEEGDAEVPGVGEEKPPGMATEENIPKKSESNPNLHKNLAIFLRNVPVDIPRAELEKFLGQYAGFQRLALSEPLFERKVIRRGWATFASTVQIQEVCDNIKQAQVMGHSLQPIINRELKQRVRPISGNMAHRRAARADLRNAARIALRLDTKWGVWRTDDRSSGSGQDEREEMEGADALLQSWTAIAWNGCSNPVLRDAGEMLLEFGDAEDQDEDDDMLNGARGADTSMELAMQRDETLLRKLDAILLYLRIVHSLDYYSGTEYPQEDEMPQRCGIVHARGSPSARLTVQDLQEWRQHIGRKLGPWLSSTFVLSPEDMQALGAKESDPQELQKILAKSFVEIKQDKWRCLVCEKMFKGEEFVKKHLLAKHGMEEKATSQARYFNNYVQDPRRPHLSEHPVNRSMQAMQGQSANGQGMNPANAGGPFSPFFMPPGPFANPNFMQGFGGQNQQGNGQSGTSPNSLKKSMNRSSMDFQRSSVVPDARSRRADIASYEDLDAPKDDLPF